MKPYKLIFLFFLLNRLKVFLLHVLFLKHLARKFHGILGVSFSFFLRQEGAGSPANKETYLLRVWDSTRKPR